MMLSRSLVLHHRWLVTPCLNSFFLHSPLLLCCWVGFCCLLSLLTRPSFVLPFSTSLSKLLFVDHFTRCEWDEPTSVAMRCGDDGKLPEDDPVREFALPLSGTYFISASHVLPQTRGVRIRSRSSIVFSLDGRRAVRSQVSNHHECYSTSCLNRESRNSELFKRS